MPTFKNKKDLENYLKQKINKVLENEVFETVREVALEHVKTDVFDANPYPSTYERRTSEGIDDPQNVVKNTVTNGVLEVENITNFDERYETENHWTGLSELIEYGHEGGSNNYGYNYTAGEKAMFFMQPRPFIENTREDLKENEQHIDALKIGLRKNGLKVE